MFHRRLRNAALPALFILASAFAHADDHGIDSRYLDTSISPCEDFFRYANGRWLRDNAIPADHDVWGIDEEIDKRNLDILKHILDDAAANPGARGSNTQKIGDFYAAAIDEAAIERAGFGPLEPELAEIDALKSTGDVAELIRRWHARGLDPLFELQAQEDLADSTTAIAYAGQGGLGLPDSDYYLRTDTKSALLRARYRAHVMRMLGLIGERNASTEADSVMALETRLAKASLDPVALRDPTSSYHIYTMQQADAKTPHFAWSALFAAMGRGDTQRFSLAQPEFFVAVDHALVEVPVVQWQAYLRWHLVDDAAPYLARAFVDADFDFSGHTLHGTKAIKPRWQRAIASVDAALGEALGQVYVAQVMPPEARQRALELVENLKAAMRERLRAVSWMSESTRAAALAKLDSLGAKIGYPEHWRDYSGLEISRDSYYANVRAALAFEARRQFAKFERPVDRGEWDLTPQTVNAYNNPMRNEIVFPAAQLLPPYFDANADDAANYGAIGAVIGHEMLHSFDDEGSRFDARGNLKDWWTSEDRAHFDERTQRLVEQFNAYVPIDSLHVNGQLTLGENIADLGGLLVAYDAFKRAAQGHGDVAGVTSEASSVSTTPDQRFFIAYAQSWREQQRAEMLRRQLQSNEHAPASYRVNGPVSNSPAFAAAFSCKSGDAMVRGSAQVKIW